MISLIKFGDINTNITKFEVLMDGFGLGKYVSDIKSGKDVTINDSNSNLSGGEKQKIAIIRQLIQCPDVEKNKKRPYYSYCFS